MERDFYFNREPFPKGTIGIQIGPWETHNLKKKRKLPKAIQGQASEMVERWIEVFPKEETWIQANFAVPSLIVRIDGVDKDGKLYIFEIEDRPAGLGHTNLLNPNFKSRLEELKKSWPEFDVVVSPLRDRADDSLWNTVASFEEARDSNKLILVRAEPEEEQFRIFQPRSVSTIASEGDKSYGVDLGLWRFVSSEDQFPRHESFVLKPLQSSKARNMAFYDIKSRPSPGNMKMKNVRKVLQEQVEKRGGMYLQELITPMESGIETHPLMIYRFFLGFNCKTSEWSHLGGSWFARNNLKIHGHSDSLSGPLVI